MIGEYDRWLFEEGTHIDLHDVLGAHVHEDGTTFRVWAPNAQRVTLIGDFNGWDPWAHDMMRIDAGIWELDVPGLGAGQRYKFHIERDGWHADKTDPMALHNELPPGTASVTWTLGYEWGDAAWMEERGGRQTPDAPMSIYELHLGSWHGPTQYRRITEPLIEWVARQGYTHVELMPPMEHPFFGSWGYQTASYFAPTSRYGVPQDLMFLIDSLHQAGIGVLLDWVPSHFPMDGHSLIHFDGTHLYEPADWRIGYHPDWGSAIFDYGRPEVRAFLASSANFWIDRYHIDGLRVDAVASMLYRDYSREDGEWIPNEFGGREHLEAIGFLRHLNESLYTRHPGIQTIAEESTAWPLVSRPVSMGGLGFGYKWDMGWMNDTLRYIAREPVHRAYHHNELTFRAVYAGQENFVLPLSHDEVVHGKGSLLDKQPGDEWQRFAGLRLLLGHQWTTPGKKLLFMGGDIGAPNEWNHDSGLPWHVLDEPLHHGIAQWVADLNHLYRNEPALHRSDDRPEWFRWVVADDAGASTIAFVRYADGARPVLVVSNFTPEVWKGYRFGLPEGGRWEELLNGDAESYGGSGVGNLGGVAAEKIASHGYDWSVVVDVPPLATMILAPETDPE
ncbi:MAG TPA: 1,4-alpha-glucan branching protein GlgB [Acidimicrobiia bacterium]|nr:1,4-alpha-glucan branching protein GlgB [Acidimicrobiia bacterium]